MELYNNIKYYRKKIGLTQTDLALKMGYTDKSMISQIERGKVDLPLSKVEEFAKIFGVSPGTLMGWDCDESLNDSNSLVYELFNELDIEDQAYIVKTMKLLKEDRK